MNNAQLFEGGAAGHMAHPYEVLSPSRFIGFINDLLKGRTEAYEKVDGANLMVGFDNYNNVVYVRSKKAKPSANIDEKFPITHPGSDAFRAGFKAIKKGFRKLSEKDKEKYGLDTYFINCEIIFGFVPNIVPYSETKNYVVFHGYVDPEKDFEPVDAEYNLNDLADVIGQMSVISDVVSYIGTPAEAERIVSKRTSAWEFKGPIKIDKEDIGKTLEPVLKAWKNIGEIKQLRAEKDPEKQFELMRAIADKVGSIILTKMVSKLAGPGVKVPPEHPRIEGLVVKYRKGLDRETLLKITGDFRELNQELWGPLRNELDPIMKSFNMFMLSEVFGISKISKFGSKTMNKYKSTDDLFRARSTKKLGIPYNKQKINDKIDDSIKKLEGMWNRYEGTKSMKAEDIKKALLINGYKLRKLKHNINKADLLGKAFKAYMLNMWGWGKV